MNAEPLRTELHAAVDEVLNRHLTSAAGGAVQSPHRNEVEVSLERDHGPWSYRWPAHDDEEQFFASRWYTVDAPGASYRVLLAWARRDAWKKSDRIRAIAFLQQGDSDSDRFYPWTEFVETDDGRFAAGIPDPEAPRRMLSDGDELPARFNGLAVARSDQVFDSVTNGPSLRLVVSRDDETAMIQHGFWVASLRGRV